MRLNLGCGQDKREGWTNVDKMAAAAPDEVVDLEVLPWPWAESSIEEVAMKDVLEHLGADTDIYLGIIKELYRVCQHDASIQIIVPHPRHDTFLGDPTHVRPITPQGLELFSKRRNREWAEKGNANTPLGLYLDVDFELDNVNMVPATGWRERLMRQEINMDDLMQAERMYNNVILETHIDLRIVKKAG